MSGEISTALIAGTAAVAGAAVPTLTSLVDRRADRERAEMDREFERDRSWERYQTGLRACYRKFLDSIEDSELDDDGLIKVNDIRELRQNFYEAYFAADDEIKRQMLEFWPEEARSQRRPPASEGQPLLDAMYRQTKRSRLEQEAINRKADAQFAVTTEQ